MPIKDSGYNMATHEITSYEKAKWIVIKPGDGDIDTSGVTTTFDIADWTNMPYVINGGVYFKGYVWVDGNII